MSRVFKGCLGVFLLFVLPSAARAWDTNDWEFIDMIQQASFRAYRDTRIGPYQLTCDTIVNNDANNYGPITSIAGIGFKLASMCVGHYRGWISYGEAYGEVLRLLKAFGNELSADPNVFPRVSGWTYHFYNNGDGTKNDKDGTSLLDHMLFIAGVIIAGEYFKGTEAADIAFRLYAETQWDSTWTGDNDYTTWAYSENLLAIIEAADAPQHNKHGSASNMWASVTAGIPYQLPLYYWQYPHCYIDFRSRRDPRNLNHSDIARDTILHQRQWCTDRFNEDPVRYDTYTNGVFGLSTCGASDGYRIMNAIDEWSCDSGSIAPICIPPCMIYAGTETMAVMKYLYYEHYLNGWDPEDRAIWSDVHGWLNCFNIGVPINTIWTSGYFNWMNADIDYGPNVLMLENHRLGTVWRYFMQNPFIEKGMQTVGFGADSTIHAADFTNSVNQFGGGLGHWANGGATSGASFVSIPAFNAWVCDKAVRIAANGPASGSWIELGGWDQRGKALLSFWIKGHTGHEKILVGLKDVFYRENKADLLRFTGGVLPTNWTQVKIPMEEFCITGVISNDLWPGNLSLVSFEFTNSAGGGIDVDYLAFTADTLAPPAPTSRVYIAHYKGRPRIGWEPNDFERDVVGCVPWRRTDPAGAFSRPAVRVGPVSMQCVDDTSPVAEPGRRVEYALLAVDNAEPQNVSAPGPTNSFIFLGDGRTDVDWNNGHNPNLFGGTNDGYWGGGTAHSFAFVQALSPFGWTGWVRRSFVSVPGGGHYVDMNNGDAADHSALAFYIKGAVGGESIRVGLKDSDSRETKVDVFDYLGGAVSTNWARVMVPFSDFTNVNKAALYNISFTHATSGTVDIADLCFVVGRQSDLALPFLFEAENCVTQRGASARDFKNAASGREVLGNSWGETTNSYAEYTVCVERPLDNQRLNARYACDWGDGRVFEVWWNGALIGLLNCTNTGGWGDWASHYSWASCALPSLTAGCYTLQLTVSSNDTAINLDAFSISRGSSWYHECEQYTTQIGSSNRDFKTGASCGEVLGWNWGWVSSSEVAYAAVGGLALTSAWFHLSYALYSDAGRELDVYIDGVYRTSLVCPPTGGWGTSPQDFDTVSEFIGPVAGGSHTVLLRIPTEHQAINLDCFSLSDSAPEYLARDVDRDGFSDRQERVLGTRLDLADSDGDGMNDRDEWIAGTDPNVLASLFQCLEFSTPIFPMIGKILRWPSSTGRVYSISVSSSLVTGHWSLVTSSLPATPPENVWTDTVDRAEQNLFYKIVVGR